MLSVEDIITIQAAITPVLVKVINNMLLTGEFPEPLNVSKVVAIHKKASRQNPENYRPISLVARFVKK